MRNKILSIIIMLMIIVPFAVLQNSYADKFDSKRRCYITQGKLDKWCKSKNQLDYNACFVYILGVYDGLPFEDIEKTPENLSSDDLVRTYLNFNKNWTWDEKSCASMYISRALFIEFELKSKPKFTPKRKGETPKFKYKPAMMDVK